MTNKQTWWLIGGFGVIKLLLHVLTNTNYGLHRDEFLYLDQGRHLAWGFHEVPPFTPFIGKIIDLLGASTFTVRLFPALAGVVIIVLACKLVKDLGGGRWSILITGTSLVLTTSLLGSNSLFQPVSFNQLFWFLIAYAVVQLLRTKQRQYYYYLGVFIGIGILTKYSLLFYLLALLIGVLLTPQRKLLWDRSFLQSLLIALLIVLPNMIWQMNQEFPVLEHMQELQETQLVHVQWSQFLTAQFIAHKGFTLIWLWGLVALFTVAHFKEYRSLGWAFLITVLLIGALHGKSYYTLGAFLVLFPFGGLAIEQQIQRSWVRAMICALAFLITVPFYPLSLPILKVDQLKTYTHYLSERYGVDYMLRWEDGEYHALPADQKASCMIYGGSYGHAGSLNFFRQQYDLPEAYSFNGSYVFWAKEEVEFDKQIMVDDRKQDGSQWFAEMVLVDSIEGINAREKGYIYYRAKPKIDVQEAWRNTLIEERGY